MNIYRKHMGYRKKPPCAKDCADRKPGCHDKCDRFKEWRAELDRVNAAREQFNKEYPRKRRISRWDWP